MKKYNTLGIDIGNINTKITVDELNTVFSSRIYEIKNHGDLLNSDEIVNIDGIDYIIGTSGEYENNHDKYTKANYLILLKYAIAKYSKDKNVYLSLGLPISHYNKKDVTALKSLILANRSFEVKINNIQNEFEIKEVSIIPESFGIYDVLKNNDLFNNSNNTLIIDIGGGTTDVSYINSQGKYQHELSNSIDYGLLDFYRLVSDSIYVNCNKLRLNIEETKEFCRGNNNYIGVDKSVIKESEIKLFNKILNELKGKFSQIAYSNIIIVGGGAEVFADYFKNIYSQTIILNDIYLNSKVFYKVGVKKFNE